MKYRITKYDPVYRDQEGCYIRDEWTSISDIGKVYNGVPFTLEAYLQSEENYVRIYAGLLKQFGVDYLNVRMLEKSYTLDEITRHLNVYDLSLNPDEQAFYERLCNDCSVNTTEFHTIFRMIMRELLWCRLENGEILIEFGYDYYTYITCPEIPEKCIQTAANIGIFIEAFK